MFSVLSLSHSYNYNSLVKDEMNDDDSLPEGEGTQEGRKGEAIYRGRIKN